MGGGRTKWSREQEPLWNRNRRRKQQGFSVGRSNPNAPPKSNRLLTPEVEVRHTSQNLSLPKRKTSRLPKANGNDGRLFQSPLDSSDWRPSKFRNGCNRMPKMILF